MMDEEKWICSSNCVSQLKKKKHLGDRKERIGV